QIHGEGVSAQQSVKPVAALQPNGATKNGSVSAPQARKTPATPIEIDRAGERIEAWMLGWLVNRLSMDSADVARDRPFAEYGVDSLTAVELSQELEDQFKVPLPAIVAWNYPTPATLARYSAEQTLAVAEPTAEPTSVVT